jgi:hypothetical protein
MNTYAIKTYVRVEVQLHAFLTSALDGGEWSASRPGHFTPKERAFPRYPLDSGPQNRSGSGGEEKNSLTVPIIEPLSSYPCPSHCSTELHD